MQRQEMLGRLAADGRVPLGCLTEEELAAVGAGERTPFQPAALAAALRGLLARGLLEPPDGGLPLRAHDELDTILGVRRAPAAVVFAGQPSFFAVLHGFREERLTGVAPGISGFLEERTGRLARHHFTVRTTRNAVDTLVVLADPAGGAPALPPDRAADTGISADTRRALREFGPGVTRLDACHIRPGGIRRIQASFLVRPGEAFALRSASGVEPEQPRVSAVTAGELRQVVREVLCDPGGDPPGGKAMNPQEGEVESSDGPPFRCPVCGYPGLDEPPRVDGLYASYEICPSCGFEFGVTDDDRGFNYADWRREWVAGGRRWWSRAHRKPPGWDPDAQLRALLGSGPGDETGRTSS